MMFLRKEWLMVCALVGSTLFGAELPVAHITKVDNLYGSSAVEGYKFGGATGGAFRRAEASKLLQPSFEGHLKSGDIYVVRISPVGNLKKQPKLVLLTVKNGSLYKLELPEIDFVIAEQEFSKHPSKDKMFEILEEKYEWVPVAVSDLKNVRILINADNSIAIE